MIASLSRSACTLLEEGRGIGEPRGPLAFDPLRRTLYLVDSIDDGLSGRVHMLTLPTQELVPAPSTPGLPAASQPCAIRSEDGTYTTTGLYRSLIISSDRPITALALDPFNRCVKIIIYSH